MSEKQKQLELERANKLYELGFKFRFDNTFFHPDHDDFYVDFFNDVRCVDDRKFDRMIDEFKSAIVKRKRER